MGFQSTIKFISMAKRFTDTEKWKKPFIRNLPTKYKVLWLYIIDECNHAGIWQVDLEVAQIRTGEVYNVVDAIEIFGSKIEVFDEGEKWFIPSFIEFQYGVLNDKNRVHESVISNLDRYNLREKNKGLTSPLQRAKYKYKDKDNVLIHKEWQKISDFEEQGYTFGLSENLTASFDDFLKYKFERGEAITNGQVIEKIIKEMLGRSLDDSELIRMLDFTISRSAKNVITNLPKTENDFEVAEKEVDILKRWNELKDKNND